ncbi:MAG: succinate dehydrogenase cytochrome b subunit [Gemmataceae bacterium]|nr:succinate dehydrogenase cytochrome b subunit [Gemmataceae bacterium]
MATAETGTVRYPKGPAEPPTGPKPGVVLRAFLDASVGAKLTVGATGVALVLFTVFHLIGNLKMLPGGSASRDAINAYANFLKHDLGLLIWFARGGLLVLFVLHIVLAVRLKIRSVRARPVAYAYQRSAQATISSRTMIWSGIVIGVFVLFHLAHYTFGVVKPAVFNGPVLAADASAPDGFRVVPAGQTVPYLELRDPQGRHDVYNMVVAGFTNPVVTALYLISQLVLFLHLRHGIPSTFQTLGIKNASTRGPVDLLGLLVALFILAGNCLIVVAVQVGYTGPVYAA